MKTSSAMRTALTILLFLTATWAGISAQQPENTQSAPSQTAPGAYQPKFPADPAHSDPEFLALAYMRVVVRAQYLYKKRHQHYATSLPELAGTGSFTKRMGRSTDRGDYTVEFHSKTKGESYTLSMVPKQYDAQHRAFFASDDGVIHGEEGKPANEDSPKVK